MILKDNLISKLNQKKGLNTVQDIATFVDTELAKNK